MTGRRAICIAVDGLRASALGAYGGYGTPGLDDFAGQSLVAEWMWAAGPKLADFYAALETGRLASSPSEARDSSLLEQLADAGVGLSLTTDDDRVAACWEAIRRCDVRTVAIETDGAAASFDDTALARLFAVAADQLLDATTDRAAPRLFWIHARGMHGPWDAPRELHEALLDDDDPPPLESVVPPDELQLDDPDELLRYRTAYAAQTAVLDQCVAGLLAALDVSGLGDSALIALVGVRGFALGEHGRVGRGVRQLYNEFLHAPLMVRSPGRDEPIPRLAGGCHPVDLTATLLEWFDLKASRRTGDGVSLLRLDDRPTNEIRPWNFCASDDEISLRTPAWMLRQIDKPPRVELFTKPDDRWEANEVADRCPDIVEQMQTQIAAIQRALARQTTLAESDLPEDLVRPVR